LGIWGFRDLGIWGFGDLGKREKGKMIGEDERMEEVLTRDFMSTTSGGIRLVTSRTGLNVFDTMGLEGVVGGTNISDVSTVSTQHVSMTGIPLAGGGGGGGGIGGIGGIGGRGKKYRRILERLDFGSDGTMNAHKAALSIRNRRVKRGKGGGAVCGGARANITDASNVDINMRQFQKAVEPYIEDFHKRNAYENTPEGRRELSVRQQEEAEKAIRELEALMGFAEGDLEDLEDLGKGGKGKGEEMYL
jgi:hypothetical protein